MKHFNTGRASRVSKLTLAAVMAVAVSAQAVSAGSLTGSAPTASIVLSNQSISGAGLNPGTNVNYKFNLSAATTASNIQCIAFQTQTPQSTNAKPTGMTFGTGALTSVSGIGGTGTFAYDTTNSTPATGYVRYTNASATTPTNPISVTIPGVTNPTAAGTYFIVATTYTNTACTTPASGTDTGTMAFVITDTNNSYTSVTGLYGETLTFALSSNSVTLSPNLDPTLAASTATNTMTVKTNAVNGYTVSGQAAQFASGANTIPFGTTGVNTAAFALNNSGGCASGASCPGGDFNPNSPGATGIVSRTTPTNSDVTTMTYKASVANATPSGNYSTVVNYVASGQF